MLSRTSLLSLTLFFVGSIFTIEASADEKEKNRPAQRPTTVAIRAWVSNLASAKFDERETALVQLIEAGKPAIAPLAEAVMSGDPEVAWRAATALEAIGLKGDEAILGEIKTRMERTKGTPNRDLAQILSTLTQRWAQMQQTRSQAALVKLGATFPDANAGYPTAYKGAPAFMGSYVVSPTTFSSSGTVVIESYASPVPAAPPAIAVFDPLAVPSSLERIISGMEKIEAVKAKEDEKAAIDKEDPPKEDVKKEEPKSESKQKEDVPPKADEKKSAEKAAPAESKPAESEAKKSEDAKPEEPKEPTTSSDASTGDKAAPEPVTVTFSAADIVLGSDAIETSFVSPPPMGGMPTAAAYGAIRLDQNYHGGDSGLVHLAGLPHISMLDIQDAPLTDKAIPYIAKMPSLASIMIRGTKITPEALFKLKKAKPALSIRGQGRGILGVNADEAAAECTITVVRPGAPSEAAGILVGDRIIKLDGKDVTDFLSLTVQMMKREPGEVVKVTIKRGEETLEKTVKLGSREELSR
jgi:hypothetical protein